MARTNAISISDGFIPSKIDTPLDERSRVKTFNEIADIPRPYVGMVIYVEDEDAYYSVKSLKAKNIGGIMVNNAQVNEVKPFGGNSQSKGGMPVVQFDLSLTDGECAMMPNTYYVFGEANYLYLYFSGADPSIVNEYCCEFTAGGNGCTLLLADDVLWANGNTPEIEGGKTYQLSVVNNLAIITEF